MSLSRCETCRVLTPIKGVDMLCLGRTQGQDVVIDDKIIVRVLKITGKRVSLGFKAPNSVAIVRRELLPGQGIEAQEDSSGGGIPVLPPRV